MYNLVCTYEILIREPITNKGIVKARKMWHVGNW